jgi:FG-GAP-like repeat/Bacterial pre-peptidase C-terminal domain
MATSLVSDPMNAALQPPGGYGDLLWRNTLTGADQRRLMSGSNLVGSQDLLTIPDQNWQAQATGDFNHDGQSDILWRNRATGENGWWLMTANGSIAEVRMLLQIPDQAWQIVGTGDSDRDGQLDILWRNQTTGQTGWWLMEGNQLRAPAMLAPEVDSSWQVTGVGDVNQDGHPDVFWRQQSTGLNGYWLMSGTTRLSGVYLSSESNPNLKIVGVGDLNRDGHPDLIWQDQTTGNASLWLLEGATTLGKYALPGGGDPNWKITGVMARSASPEPDASDTLLGAEVQSGPIFFRAQTVNSTDQSDFYRFNLTGSGIFSADLTGLAGDADVRLIQDANLNGVIDSGEVLGWQWERGSKSEQIRRFLTAGSYVLQVSSYHSQAANYALSTNFTSALSDPQRFTLQVSFGEGSEGLNATARSAIVAAAQFWESAILTASPLLAQPSLTLNVVGKTLNQTDGSADLSTLAYSGPNLVSDGQTITIQTGTATINTRRLDQVNADPTALRLLMIHEFAHTLGFGTLWQPIGFLKADGTILNLGKSLIDQPTVTYNGASYAGYAYGELLGTYQPTAVPLDPGGLAHWSEARFDTELLTPYIEFPGVAMPLSQLTLAALRDLGWGVNYGAAQAYSLPA